MKFDSNTIDKFKTIWDEFAKSIESKFDYKEIVSPHSNSVTYKFEIRRQSELPISILKSYICQISLNPIVKPLVISTVINEIHVQKLYIRKSDFLERIFFKYRNNTPSKSINEMFMIKSRDFKLINKLFSNKRIVDYFLEFKPELVVAPNNEDSKLELRIYKNDPNLRLMSESYEIFNLLVEQVK